MIGRRRTTVKVTPDLRAELGMTRHERVLGTARAHGRPAVATDLALYLAGERVPWEQVVRAEWNDPILEVTVTDASRMRNRRIRADLAEIGDLPQAVHVQVTASVTVQRRIDLGQGRGALAVARQGVDGEVRWQVLFDAGLDVGDPELRRSADQALARLRDSLGV